MPMELKLSLMLSPSSRACRGTKHAQLSCETKLYATLRACAEGERAPNLALMHFLASAASEADAHRALDDAIAGAEPGSAARQRLEGMAALWRDHPSTFGIVRGMHALAATTTDWRQTFDAAARLSPEAGVALYSLGDKDLLSAATGELVELMQSWALLQRDGVVLDLGCGIGRVAVAIAPCVARVIALDVAPEMARLAAERTCACGNAGVIVGEGTNLAFFADSSFDLVLAIDSFPYLVASGCAAAHIAEIVRVLKESGRMLVMNWSYRGDPAGDSREVAELAAAHGLSVLRNGTSPLSLWDGRAFLLEKTVRTSWPAPS
jgi:SAM-dependent methyltransferase